MDNSVGSAIEKIKLQEQDKEAKLKEKREIEASVALLQRNIRETTNKIQTYSQEEAAFSEKNTKLKFELNSEKIRNKALLTEKDTLKNEFKDLKNKINQDITHVWNLRTSFCDTVQRTSDDYNVWALLMKPVYTEPVKKTIMKTNNEIVLNSGRLEAAMERQAKAIAERNRLLAEPDNGEEFVRIKNALRYSLEHISKLKGLK